MRPLQFSLAIAAGILFSTLTALAWAGPTATPPNNNVEAPINVSANAQIKSGDIGILANLLLGAPGGSYLNFGATSGSSGYGIRDNAGTLEFKSTGGSWNSLTNAVTNVLGIGAVTQIKFADGTTQTTAGGGSGGTSAKRTRVELSSGSATCTFTGSTWLSTKLSFNTVVVDEASLYNTSTGRFTPPTGKWLVIARVYSGNSAPYMHGYIFLYKNGVSYDSSAVERSGGTANLTADPDFQTVIDGNGSDYYELYYNPGNCSGSVAISISANAQFASLGVSSGSGGGTQLSAIRSYTSNATWTKPSNLSYAVVEAWGAGGGGGGACSGGSASGGGSGGYAMKRFSSSDLAATVAVSIGAGGSGGAIGVNGTAGTASSFGSVSGGGGAGGSVGCNINPVGGMGGTATGGDINFVGQAGDGGATGASNGSAGGTGGSAPRGGSGGYGGYSTGGTGQSFGGGGGGGSASAGGGGGGAGGVIVNEYTTS